MVGNARDIDPSATLWKILTPIQQHNLPAGTYIDCANDSEISLRFSAQLPIGTALSTTVVSPDGKTIASEHIGDVPTNSSRKSTAEGLAHDFSHSFRLGGKRRGLSIFCSYL